MNALDFCGDLSHLLAVLLLLAKIWRTRSCAGVSGKSQILFAIVCTTRYLDLLTTFVSVYSCVMKAMFVFISYGTLYLMYFKFKSTYDRNDDNIRIVYIISSALVLSFFTARHYTVMEILWTYSVCLEAVAIALQLYMILRTGEVQETVTRHYVCALGSYIALYLMNWIPRNYTGNYPDWIVASSGIVLSISYSDFLVQYVVHDTLDGHQKDLTTNASQQQPGHDEEHAKREPDEQKVIGERMSPALVLHKVEVDAVSLIAGDDNGVESSGGTTQVPGDRYSIVDEHKATTQERNEQKVVAQEGNKLKAATQEQTEQKVVTLKQTEQKVVVQKQNEQKTITHEQTEQKLVTQKLNEQKLIAQKQTEKKVETQQQNKEKLETKKQNEQKAVTQEQTEQKLVTQKQNEQKAASEKQTEQKVVSQEQIQKVVAQEQKVVTRELKEQKIVTQEQKVQKVVTQERKEHKMVTLERKEQKLKVIENTSYVSHSRASYRSPCRNPVCRYCGSSTCKNIIY